MTQTSYESRSSQKPRRWPRHKVDLPVRIIATNGLVTAPILARGNDVSRAGMALHAAVALTPGDKMDLEFATPTPLRVSAIVRNRIGNRLGLEFLTQLPSHQQPNSTHKVVPAVPAPATPSRAVSAFCDPELLTAGLQKKREQLSQLRKEIDALTLILPLLADNQEEVRQPAFLRSEKPWPAR